MIHLSCWTVEREAELRRLWGERPMLSAAEIGRRMGLNKNTVIGKANRLHLEPRESPIVRKPVEVVNLPPVKRPCQWIENADMCHPVFCGAECVDIRINFRGALSPWCEEHHHMVYVTDPVEKQRRAELSKKTKEAWMNGCHATPKHKEAWKDGRHATLKHAIVDLTGAWR